MVTKGETQWEGGVCQELGINSHTHQCLQEDNQQRPAVAQGTMLSILQ